jgi:hypothetical protein
MPSPAIRGCPGITSGRGLHRDRSLGGAALVVSVQLLQPSGLLA